MVKTLTEFQEYCLMGLDHNPEARALVEKNFEVLNTLGVEMHQWDDEAPCCDEYGLIPQELMREPGSHLFDHMKMLVYPHGRKVYVTEPYGLSAEAFRFLASLEDEWQVTISQFPLHYPGRTVPVWIERRNK